MTDFPTKPKWAEQLYFPNLGGGNPWETGTSPTKVDPPASLHDYGATPDQPHVAAYENWYKGEVSTAVDFQIKQSIGHWGNVNLEAPYKTGVARVPMPNGGWLSCGFNAGTLVNTALQIGPDAETQAPYQDLTSSVQDNTDYACTNLAGDYAFFHSAGVGYNVIGINLNTGVDGEETPPLAGTAEEWSDIHCTPQGTLLMGGVGRFAHRTVGGAWSVVTPVGLGVGIHQTEWWFYSSPDCPTPNRVWAMNRHDEFIYSDDGGLTWSAVVNFAIGTGGDCVARPVWDKKTQQWVTVQCDDPTVLAGYKVWHSADGVNWSGVAGDLNMNVTGICEFGGVIYGIAILAGEPLAFRAAQIVYSTDAGLTWTKTGKVLAFVCPTTGVGSFPHSYQWFERNFRIQKAPWGIIAVAHNVNSNLVHACALKPFVSNYPLI